MKSSGKKLLLTVSFVEGSAVMIIELLGAKIIAPYYGTSLYVWSSVLGVTLGALAFGYYTGGVITKKYNQEKSLFIILFLGAFFAAISPLLAIPVMEITSSLGVRLGSLVSVLIYLFPPIALMGMVSPIIIHLINDEVENTGNSAGTVYAISTIGGILATFLAGFYLIPELGIRSTAFIISGILFLIPAIYFLVNKKTNLVILQLLLVLMVALSTPNYVNSSENITIVYNKVGVLGEWTVVDNLIKNKDGAEIMERKLLLNGIDQTYTQVGYEPLSLWAYPHQIGAYASIKPVGSKALLLGMGGGSIVHELVSLGLDVDIVELDKNVDYISRNYFNYDDAKSNLYIDDARHFIRTSKEQYDIVIIDLALGEIQPAHVFSLEGFEDLKKIIHSDALVIINFQGNLDIDEYAMGPKSIFKTLQSVGFTVKYYYNYSEESNDQLANDMFFLASLQELDYESMFENVRYNEWFPYEHFTYQELISNRKLDLSNALILIDDKPKLEILNASTILEWRKNKQYQNINRLLDQNLPIY